MKTLVVGYGSIGSRHVQVLRALGCDVSVVSRRNGVCSPSYSSIYEALKNETFEYAIIATETSSHFSAVSALSSEGFGGVVLVEKPIFDSFYHIPSNSFSHFFVGYNLRFHPFLQMFREVVRTQSVVSLHAYVGQFLPSWRIGRDYRKGYWAHKSLGGGVLRELSHELDYVTWLLGPWNRLTASGGHLGSLEIEGDDVFSILLKTELCKAVSIHINCLDRVSRREITMNTMTNTYRADFVTGSWMSEGKSEKHEIDRNHTYQKQHEAILEGRFENLCSAEDGLFIMKMIEAIENASDSEEWIERSQFLSCNK